jgi:hypothetical protein
MTFIVSHLLSKRHNDNLNELRPYGVKYRYGPGKGRLASSNSAVTGRDRNFNHKGAPLESSLISSD